MTTNNDIIYLNQKFIDFDQFNEAIKKWTLDFKQLDSGRFIGELTILDLNKVQVLSAQFNRKFDQKGATPQGFKTFAIPADNNQSFIWRNSKVHSNNILVFPKSGELDASTPAGFNVYTISIADKILEDFNESLNYDNINLIDKEIEVFELNAQSINTLRNQLKYLFAQISSHPEIVNKKAFQQIFTKEVPSLILNNLAHYKSFSSKSPMRIRDVSFKKAVDYISACTNDFPSILELCLIVGASQRTLEYAFKERYGIGPKDFIKKHQLNLVRKSLKNANPEITKIYEIAQKYGFWHMSRFASDYKKMFGELPSRTLSLMH